MSKKKTDKKIEEDTIESLTAKLKPAEVRFLYLYLGGEEGKGWNNATISYIIAYDIDTSLRRNAEGKYSKEYLNAKSRGYEILTKRDIQKLRALLLGEAGYKPENIKKRYIELQAQNRNPIVALQANDRMAKIAGVIDDNKKVNIPELEELGNAIRGILTPKR
jgi:hypothetical protein